MKYHAFISYNKAADQDLAPAIRKGLEKFAKPVFKRKALNIFLDSSALSATPDLWHSIENGLANAEYFIFLASPGSAKSPWCVKELEYWKQHKEMNKLLLIWTGGKLDWDNLNGDFNWNTTTALPVQLKGAFKNEPLYLDLRGHPPTEELTLTDPTFRNQIGMLAAPLHQRALEDLLGEDISIHRRTIRLRNGAIVILSILLITSILLSVFALQQKNIAEKKAIEALARSYIADSKANFDLNPTLSVRLAEYAYLFAKSNSLELENFEDQLIKAYYNPSNFYLSPEGFQPDGDSIITKHEFADYKLEIDENSSLLYLINTDGMRRSFPNEIDYSPDYFTFSPKGRFVITETEVPGASYAGTVRVMNIYYLSMKKVAAVTTSIDYGTKGYLRNRIKFDSTETRFIITGEEPGTSIYDVGPGEVKHLLLHGNSRDVTDVAITTEGSQVALSRQKGVVDLYRIDSSELRVEELWQLRGHALQSIHSIKYSRDENYTFTQSTSYKRKWHAYNDVRDRYARLPEVAVFDEEIKNVPTLGEKGQVNFRFVKDSIYITYIDKTRDIVTKFNFIDEGEGDEAISPDKWTTGNGRYYATRNGLFNKRGELLIDYNEARHKYKFEVVVIGFSTDSKFFFLVDKIYFLDAGMIISRINDKGRFGSVAPLTAEDKVAYQVSDLN